MKANSTLILNVDDNDGARYAKNRILQGAGFEVVEATNGTDALDMVKRLCPALVLLDVKLPDINGIEVCRRIKANPDSAMVLVLQTSAALTGRADKIRGLEGGADNYLAAPIEADELIANVNALLRMRQTQVELRDSEERFRQITDNIDDVFWMFAVPEGELVYVSPAYSAVWGGNADDLRQRPRGWLDVVHPDDRERIAGRWRQLRETPHYDDEFRILGPDGRTHWVRDRLFAVRNARGEVVRVATGRRPNTAGLGLERAGIQTDRRGAVVVDETLRTTNPRVWAAGDVAGAPQFVYVAAYEGTLAAENSLTGAGRRVDFTALPRVTFTSPQIAAVGPTEAEARAQGQTVRTALLPLRVLSRAQVNGETRGLFKLLADAQTGRLLGAHILAENAGEVIYAAVLAIKAGLTIDDLVASFAPYLTMAEGLRLAAQAFSRDVARLSCCA